MRGKGEGAVYRVPADRTKPLQYWSGALELPPVDGVRRRKVVRRKNKNQLVTELDRLKKELKQRGDLPTSDQTAEQWFTYWVEQIAAKEVRPNTLRGYRSVVYTHIIPTIGKVKLEKITAAHVRRVHDRITVEKQLSSTYALLAHRTMAVSFKAAVREGRLSRNPAELTSAPRKSSAARQALDLTEAVNLLKHTRDDPAYGARWATALLTGARQSEVLGLEIDRVTDVIDLSWQLQRLKLTSTPGVPDVPPDFEYRHIAGGLYFTRPKSSAGWRVIPLVEPLKTILEQHIAAHPPNRWGLVFTREGRPADPSKDSLLWATLLEEMGITKTVTIHDIRHSTVDLLYLAGIPEDLISDIVGHSTRTMTRAYKTRQNRDRLVVAMEQFSELISSESDSSTTPAAVEGSRTIRALSR
jgi:integrase